MTAQNKSWDTPSFAVIDAIVHKHNIEKGSAIPILQEIQETYGYIPLIAIERIGRITGIPDGDIYGTATFYKMFRFEPPGENVIKVCRGTACDLAGAAKIAESINVETSAAEGETSYDRKFTIEKLACLGCCSAAPTLMINDELHSRLTPESVRKVLKKCKCGDEGSA
ncbi:MAG: NADH-quinone oxidoreductase subunit NuoE [Actinomycetota bacterium]|nr:NADH-quinone oxidoreductase subunit NuoE [Actinomycetota bacterium]